MNAPAPLKLTDLTLPLRSGMRGVNWEPARTLEKDGCNARLLHLYSHAGTHLDAQTHFGAGYETVDTIPLSRCLGPAWVADLRHATPGALLKPEHLGSVSQHFGAGDSLLLCTNWSRHVDDEPVYRGQLPRVSEALARWCVERQTRMLGVEPPSVADLNNRDELTRVHRILLEAGVIIVEGLANLEAVVGRKILFMALPLKLEGGDGSPCRAVAIEGAPDPLGVEGDRS